ncbi:hypothetical protein [Mucilaginibacter glaciei]|uniref:Oligosaccharide repeat unit polymerase n=1 Tax=Mucilaginibacter glaciei TaxID=2772109 RepID=A0A926S523_9SPHI|nr:hypothetical protein [Mucilaginibacter glaciei]MBD1392321.1 hypothetical protein [Mucilaginibacter glaciei]
MQNIKLEYFLSFVFCTLAFIAGIAFGGRKGIPVWEPAIDVNFIVNSRKYMLLVDIFLALCLLIMVASNAVIFVSKGTLPIFAENPSEAKILFYNGGWGIVKRINFSLVNFVLAIPLINIFHPNVTVSGKKKIYYVLCILICVLVIASMGYKGNSLAIINILFAIVLINRTSGASVLSKVKASINQLLILKWAKYIFVLAIIFMVAIIALSGVETSSSDSFVTRLVSAGDVYYFFYVFDIASDFHQTALSYIPHFFNPLLGMLRLADYEFSIGVYTLYYSIGLPMDSIAVFGPNTQFPIEGLVYFGKYGAPVYSFVVGMVISAVRVGLLRKIGPNPNIVALVIYVVLSSLIVTMATDVPLFVQIFFDLVTYGSIIFVFSAILLPVLRIKNES